LGAKGYETCLGFSVGTPQGDALSRYCAGKVVYPDPVFAPEDFQRCMLELSPQFDFIVPTKEKALLTTAQIKTEIEAKGATLPIAGYESMQLATNKVEVLRRAGTLGLHVPRTVTTSKQPSIDEIEQRVGSPFIMKASTEIGLPPIERHFLVRAGDTDLFEEKFNALSAYGPVILQEFVRGWGAGVALLYSGSGDLVAFAGHRRLFEVFSDGGPSVLATTMVHPGALDQARRLLEGLSWKGIAMVEFRVNTKDEAVFMEVNPRFWGTLSLAIASGVDFPSLLLESYGARGVGRPIGPTRVRRYFSFRALATAVTSPLEKRPDLRPLAVQLPASIPRLSIKELQGADPRPEVEEFFHLLRARASKRHISKVGPILLGPAMDYRLLRRTGVRTVVDLREPGEIARRPLTLPTGLARTGFPITDDAGIDPTGFREIAQRIETATASGEVYVHCRQGKGRAPMVVIGYLAWRHLPLEQAFKTVYDARPHASLTPAQKAAIYLFHRTLDTSAPSNRPRETRQEPVPDQTAAGLRQHADLRGELRP
ncbi:MAG TPA: ATP-grasp domain-containing protein, partial [Thermoplasmata archaeon]|nr:ATP-grasp domain-containing protein [Thermoplasmata archaeon]